MDLSDEQLSGVLQHLLVSVERGVERLDWERDVRPWSCGGRRGSLPLVPPVDTRDCSVQTSPVEAAPSLPSIEVPQEDTPSSTAASSTATILDRRKFPLQMLGGSFEDEDDQDDGYCESNLSQPTTLSQLDQDLLHSRLAVLPGCRDVQSRSVVVIRLSTSSDLDNLTAAQLAELLFYFQTIPASEVSSRGLTVLVDGSEASPETWQILQEALSLFETNVPGAINRVFLWRTKDVGSALPADSDGSRAKWTILEKEEQLHSHFSRDQLLQEFGGSYVYDHQEWLCFRKFLEPFLAGCRLSGRRLVAVMQELKGGRLPGSAQLTAQMMEQQKRHLHRCTFQDEHLRHLQDEGDTILRELRAYGERAPHNPDYRESLERSSSLYGELRRAMTKLSRLADKRLARLEECLHVKTLAEESSQVLWWLRRRGEECLGKHQALPESLQGIKLQEEEFEKFYFLAMRQIEKGNDLLEEAASVVSTTASTSTTTGDAPVHCAEDSPEGMRAVASSLKEQLDSFTDRLEETRERVEDSAKCYYLLDKVYEWALETMHFVGEMRVESSSGPEELSCLSKSLDEYMDAHTPIAEEVFEEMLELAASVGKDFLLESCKKAESKCREAVELVRTRQTTLLKARQQLELESPVNPTWTDGSGMICHRSGLRPQPEFWSPPSASTPCSGFGRRRASMGSAGTPFGSCTAFPSNSFPVASLQESLRLDRYLQDKEEQLNSRGLITEDLTPQGPVASHASARVSINEDVVLRDYPMGRNCPANKLSCNSRVVTPTALPPVHRPSKKQMRMCPTWQLCEEALEKVAAQVRAQNRRLIEEGVHSKDARESLTESTEENISSLNSTTYSRTHGADEEDGRGPFAVNSHLLGPEGQPSSTDEPTLEGDQGRQKKTLMLVMRELTQTERDYVKSLEYIIDHYIPELLREDIPQALRGKRNVLFGNIEKISEFHSQYFLHELERCEDSPFLVGQCFLQYERQFYLYALYNKNKPKSDSLMSEYGTPFFRKKQLHLKDKMDLASYLLKPVQRMGKYALLLKQILKECPETEKESEYEDLKAAEEMVRFQLRHGNDLLAMDALRDCDVNVKEQGRLMRQDEFIVWQGRYRKSLRRVFLFEDLILFSKARRDPENKGQEIYQYKQSIKTTDVGFTEQIGDSTTKFEIWFRKRKLHDTYILQAASSDIKVAWAHEISRLLWRQALKNREIRLAEMSSMGFGSKPCLDIKPSVDQISTRSINLSLPRAPRYRNSIAVSPLDQLKNNKRPHSIISISSSSSSSSSGCGGATFNFYGALNLGFEPGDSPRPHRSITQQSQCSNESGFCTDVSLAGDGTDDRLHKKAERSDSILSNESTVTHLPSNEFGSRREDPGSPESQQTTPL